MAENQDLEQNQNVTENVNVAENVVETDNLAVVSYVTQNDEHIQQTENVVQIEQASENEDLDQYLVYPRNIWAYDITITMHCKLKFIANIRGCWRNKVSWHVSKEDVSGITWIYQDTCRLYFKCSTYITYCSAKFGSQVPVRMRCGLLWGRTRFFNGSLKREGDALKMALVLFANNILFSQDYRRQVTYWLMTLVKDIEAFNSFPWVLGNGGHPFDAEKIGQHVR
ncbi:hypothetical protein Q3G72_020993 [Acer saccharum]|nr:hypothetical protein Q3G72_020993 [Acer saccharum]